MQSITNIDLGKSMKIHTFIKKNKQAVIACFLGFIFICSLIPLLYTGTYAHATGDDYGYGFRAHHAWLDTQNIWQVLKAAARTVRIYYYSWQGTWFTIFLMALQPEVFSPGAYWIVPWIMILINTAATSAVLYECLVKRMQVSKAVFFSVDVLVLAAMIHFFPSTKSGIFWYNGTVHYIVPYCLAMLAVYCFLKFERKPGILCYLTAFVCMTCLGGSSYLAALLAAILLVYLLLIFGRKKKYMLWLLLPLVSELTGLYISFMSPGNSARGGEEFGFSVQKTVGTVLMCFVEGVRTGQKYWTEKPAAMFLIVLAAFLVYVQIRRFPRRFAFRCPLLFVGAMFAVWCAMFAPGIYAGVEVSGGVPNTIWQVFVLTFLAELIYLGGWMAHKSEKVLDVGKLEKGMILWGAVFLFCCFMVWNHKGTIKDTTIFNCYIYLSSGQAQDYRQQMEECKKVLLDDSLKEVYLPPINDDQGPLMHMPVTADAEAFTNRVVCEFYRKKSVLMREVP